MWHEPGIFPNSPSLVRIMVSILLPVLQLCVLFPPSGLLTSFDLDLSPLPAGILCCFVLAMTPGLTASLWSEWGAGRIHGLGGERRAVPSFTALDSSSRQSLVEGVLGLQGSVITGSCLADLFGQPSDTDSWQRTDTRAQRVRPGGSQELSSKLIQRRAWIVHLKQTTVPGRSPRKD